MLEKLFRLLELNPDTTIYSSRKCRCELLEDSAATVSIVLAPSKKYPPCTIENSEYENLEGMNEDK